MESRTESPDQTTEDEGYYDPAKEVREESPEPQSDDSTITMEEDSDAQGEQGDSDDGDGESEGDDEQSTGEGDSGGGSKAVFRRYKILYQSGENDWTVADLSEVPDGIEVQKREGDGEEFIMARNADAGRRLAWSVLGRPQGGVRVNLVAESSWKPKLLRPAPPKPSTERLEIV